MVPTSFGNPDDVTRVIDALSETLVDGPPAFADDMLTDRPESFFAREFVREAVLGTVRGEVPTPSRSASIALRGARESR